MTSDKRREDNGSCQCEGTSELQRLARLARGMALAKWIYEITRTFPSDERFGLVAQMRRAAVSIPSNIAEGQARHTTGEFVQFISHAEGSLAELETQLRLSVELGFCLERGIQNDFQLMEELRKMLNSLRRKLVTRH